jgi:hypothetical protein
MSLGADQALLEYEEREGGKVWDFVHTFTPPAKRGQGLAAQVVNVPPTHTNTHTARGTRTRTTAHKTRSTTHAWKSLVDCMTYRERWSM